MAKPTEIFVPVATLRTICGDAPELDAVLKSGHLRAKGGQVPLVSSVRAFLDAVKAGARNADLTTAQTAARTARAEAAELAEQIEARVLIPDADAEAAMLAVAGVVISQFAAIPAMSSRVVRERRLIEDLLYEAQVRLSQTIFTADLILIEPSANTQTKQRANAARRPRVGRRSIDISTGEGASIAR